MNHNHLTRFPALLAVLIMAGCASSTTPQYDRHFGEAVRTAVAQQTVKPEAARNNDPVAGLDGPAAEASMNNYEKSFAKPETGTTLSIRVGESD